MRRRRMLLSALVLMVVAAPLSWSAVGSARAEEAAPAPAAEARFVASKLRDKFHLPACEWAQKISEKNRVTYATREAAVADGKKACGTCKP